MRFLMFMFLAILSGCVSTGDVQVASPKATLPKWEVTQSLDQFTDVNTKMVTFGDFSSSKAVFTSSLNYYPFVGMIGDDLVVGLRSGGKFPIPTGTVQIRIDENEAWTIEPSETPLVLAPAQSTMPALTMDSQKDAALAATQKQMVESIQKMSSPFTVATGDKAKLIVKQMMAGKKILFRSVGVNQAGSSTGRAEIDQSFIDGIRLIGAEKLLK